MAYLLPGAHLQDMLEAPHEWQAIQYVGSILLVVQVQHFPQAGMLQSEPPFLQQQWACQICPARERTAQLYCV